MSAHLSLIVIEQLKTDHGAVDQRGVIGSGELRITHDGATRRGGIFKIRTHQDLDGRLFVCGKSTGQGIDEALSSRLFFWDGNFSGQLEQTSVDQFLCQFLVQFFEHGCQCNRRFEESEVFDVGVFDGFGPTRDFTLNIVLELGWRVGARRLNAFFGQFGLDVW